MTDMESIQPLTLPYSPASEEAILGAAIIDAEILQTVILQPEDFYIQRNGWIWAAILELRGTGQDADFITICAALDRKDQLKQVGGPARVMELINKCPSSLNAESYAEIVREKAKRRHIIQVANKLANAAYDENSNLTDAVSAGMDKLARSIVSARGAAHISQYVSQVYDEVSAAMENPSEIYGIPTGFIDWDNYTGGLQKGEVVKLSGEPGLGKSLLAMQILCNAAEKGHPGALYELEMSGRQVVRRRVSAISSIATKAMRAGKITEEQATLFTHAIDKLSALPVYISDSSVMTTADIRADLMRLKDNFGIEVAVIDYEGLIADDPEREDNQRSKIISGRVHAIFKDLDIAGLVIDDMNKEGIKGMGGKAGLSGSARKIYDADQIVIMRKGEVENQVFLTWDKNREGDNGMAIPLTKLPGFPVFKDAVPPARRK